MKTIILKGVVILLILSSCKTATPKFTNLTRARYKVMCLNESQSEKLLDLDVAIIPLVKTKPPKLEKEKTFFDLRDSLPHKYLEVLGNKVTSPEDLIKYLKEPLSNKPEINPATLPTDYSKVAVRLLIANTKKYYSLASEDSQHEFLHPNTRLEFLNTEIDFAKSKFKIISIDKLENEFEEIDLGTLERSNEVKFNSRLSGEYGLDSGIKNSTGDFKEGSLDSDETNIENVYDENGNLLGAITVLNSSTNKSGNKNKNVKSIGAKMGMTGEIGFSDTESIKEALTLKIKRLKTGFAFSDEKIKIAQRGANLLDISDNVVLTATLEPKFTDTKTVYSFRELYKNNDGKTLNPAKEITVSSRKVKYIPFDNSGSEGNFFSMDINAEGVIRTVRNRRRSKNNLEYDDLINFYKFNLSSSSNVNVNFIPFTKKVYGIEGILEDKKFELTIENPTGTVYFLDGEKMEFFNWLDKIIKIPERINLENEKFELFFWPPGLKKYKIISSKMNDEDFKVLKKFDITFKEIERHGSGDGDGG